MRSAILMMAIGCAGLLVTATSEASFKIRSVSVRGTTHVLLRDVARYYGMTFTPGSEQVRLSSKYSDLRFVVDRRESVINKVKVHLSFAPALWENEPVLSEPDFRLLLDPILRAKALPRRKAERIMLDPGHGGKDHGTSGKRYREKDIVLQIATRLATALRRQGYVVGLTRTGDTTVSLGNRTALAKAWNADLFISIHANYASDSRVYGAETFILTPAGTPSTYGNHIRQEVSPGNGFDRESARLGYEVQKNLLLSAGAVDRGIKHARFAVLRDAPCAAILVETGFLSNAREERLLGTAAYQDRIVQGLVNGIVCYRRSLLEAAK